MCFIVFFSFKEYESSSETERSDILVILGIFYPYWLTDIAILSKYVLYLAKTEKIIEKIQCGFLLCWRLRGGQITKNNQWNCTIISCFANRFLKVYYNLSCLKRSLHTILFHSMVFFQETVDQSPLFFCFLSVCIR